MFSLDGEDSLLEEQRSREGGPTTFLTRWAQSFHFRIIGGGLLKFRTPSRFYTMNPYFRRFYDNRMEVGMVVNSVNASSVFLRN